MVSLHNFSALTTTTLSYNHIFSLLQQRHRHDDRQHRTSHHRFHAGSSTRLRRLTRRRALRLRLARTNRRSTHTRPVLALLVVEHLRVLAEGDVHAVVQAAARVADLDDLERGVYAVEGVGAASDVSCLETLGCVNISIPTPSHPRYKESKSMLTSSSAALTASFKHSTPAPV